MYLKRKGMIPMKKLMNKIKMNNKGFTLVELIVVIAIIAIITVVVAPQYIGYVEKSREGVDKNAAGEIKHAAEVAYVEAMAAGQTTAVAEFTIAGDGTYTTPSDTFGPLFAKVYPSGTYDFVSKAYGGGVKVKVETTGVATVTAVPAS